MLRLRHKEVFPRLGKKGIEEKITRLQNALFKNKSASKKATFFFNLILMQERMLFFPRIQVFFVNISNRYISESME
jgi:hypothetical protein